MNNISKNYITIQGWMVSELKLNSNNLLTFGLIYGFCQDGQTEFTGSINYICNWLNCSRPTATKALNDLCEKNLIIKTTIEQNGVVFNRYKINLQVVNNVSGSKESLHGGSKESLQGSKESLHGGSKESLHNIDNINININKYNNIDSRKLKFSHTLKPFLNLYGAELLNDFYKYWTEPNKSNTKFKQELEKTWSLERRLETWAKNDKNFNQNKNGKSNITNTDEFKNIVKAIRSTSGRI